jgi:plastocyanin
MRRSLLLLTVALASVLAACSTAAAPGWTYAPPTPSPAVTAAPSASAEAPSGGGDAVAISAIGTAYEQQEVPAPADAPFVIRFDNKEAVPHNVEIKDASGVSLFRGEIVTGPVVTDYQVGALPAGTYQFVCTVHPNMIGTLTVGN